MTDKQLHDILKLIEEAKDDCHCLTNNELNSLRITCEAEIYNRSVIAFRDRVDKAMPLADCTEADWEKFYSSPWTITFAGRTVTIFNEATIYNGMLDTLNELIDNCL